MGDNARVDVTSCRATLRARREREHADRERRRLAARQAVCAAARAVMPRFLSVRRAYLFGSVVRPGGMRSTSDVDLAVEGDLTAEDYFALWRELERAAGEWPLDLVELGRDRHFSVRVREKGELVYERPDPDAEGGHCRRSDSHR